jgi:DNA polymerase I-like protein with 3'-5' exonuclease and polymerase domains
MFGKKKNINTFNPIIYTDNIDDSDLYFIVDKYWNKDTCNKFKNFIKAVLKRNLKISIIYNFKKILSKKEAGRKISDVYKKYGINILNYIPKNKRVITIGKAIYLASNGNTDIQIECFIEDVFNDTYFYSPSFETFVYPIYDFLFFIGKSTFERNFSVNQINKCINQPKTYNIKIPDLECIKVENPNSFLESYIGKNIDVAMDTETSSLDWYDNKVGCISISFNGLIGYYLNFKKIDRDIFYKFLEGKNLIWNNGKFDIKSLCNKVNAISRDKLQIGWDNWLSGHVLNEMRSNSLKSQAFYYTYFGDYEKDLESYKSKYKNINYLLIDEDILYKYACMDAIVTYQCYFKMKRRIERISQDKSIYDGKKVKLTLIELLQKHIFPIINVGIDIEIQGLNLSLKRLKETGLNVIQDKQDVEKKIREELNISKRINLSSDEQIAKHLEKLGWDCHGRNKKEFFNVNNTTLKKWLKEDHSEAQHLLLLREYEQLIKTFTGDELLGNGFWQYVKANGKVHPHLQMFLTNTLRNRCSNPNLQNLKARGLYAKEFRSCFVPPSEEYAIIESDYSGFQLRIMCILSQDTTMRDVFINQGGDLHSMTGVNVFCRNKTIDDLEKNGNKTPIDFNYFVKNKKDGDKPYGLLRYISKSCNFSLIFNTSDYNFAVETLEKEWKFKEIEDYIRDNKLENKLKHFSKKFRNEIYDEKRIDNPNFDKYWTVAYDIKKKFFESYPKVKEYVENEIEYATKYGFVPSVVGFMRKTPYLKYQGKDDESKRIKNYKNICANSPVQTFEVFCVNNAIKNIYNYLKDNNYKSKVFITVHDSIDLILHKNEKHIIKDIIKIMEQPLDIYEGLPIEAEAEWCDPLNSVDPSYWGFGYELYKKDDGKLYYTKVIDKEKNIKEEFVIG